MDFPVPVKIAEAQTRAIPVELSTIGNVQAYDSVTILSQVTGVLKSIHFKDGADVKKGDLLFTIDPAPFKEALRQAEAALQKDIAQLNFYKAQAQRYAFLKEKGAVSLSEYEQNTSSAQVYEAMVQADRATLEDAKIKLSYCYIKSPIEGTTGAHLTDEGNVVKTTDTKLVVINKLSPVYVVFSLPEGNFSKVKRHKEAGELKVTASPSDDETKITEGTLTFIDNTINKETGMFKLMATFQNAGKTLWDGCFVKVTLRLSVEDNAITIPNRAVKESQRGKYSYVVKNDMSAQERLVTVDRVYNDMAVITKGIAAGETVVTDGQLKLKSGAKVVIVKEDENPGKEK